MQQTISLSEFVGGTDERRDGEERERGGGRMVVITERKVVDGGCDSGSEVTLVSGTGRSASGR